MRTATMSNRVDKKELLEWFKRQVTYIKSNIAEQAECIPELIDIWKESDEQAYLAIVALIKPEVTEEWIGKKAKELHERSIYSTREISYSAIISMDEAKDFIRTLVEEIRGK